MKYTILYNLNKLSSFFPFFIYRSLLAISLLKSFPLLSFHISSTNNIPVFCFLSLFLYFSFLSLSSIFFSFLISFSFFIFSISAPLNLTAAQTAISNGMGNEAKIDNAIQTIMRLVSHNSSHCFIFF